MFSSWDFPFFFFFCFSPACLALHCHFQASSKLSLSDLFYPCPSRTPACTLRSVELFMPCSSSSVIMSVVHCIPIHMTSLTDMQGNGSWELKSQVKNEYALIEAIFLVAHLPLSALTCGRRSTKCDLQPQMCRHTQILIEITPR